MIRVSCFKDDILDDIEYLSQRHHPSSQNRSNMIQKGWLAQLKDDSMFIIITPFSRLVVWNSIN